MKRVLITGGAGFIGSALTSALLARGDSVVVIDNLFTGSRDNLQTAFGSDRFTLAVGDVCDRTLVDKHASACDIVVHLAARIGLKVVMASPLETLECNVRGTDVVLDAATRYGCRTLMASSSEVYGLSSQIPSRETDPITFGSPLKGRWSYACAKAIDEFFALALARERNLPATVVRLFNTVGPHQSAHYGMVLPRFVAQAIAGDPLTVYGDGSQTRSFCYVDDVVDALISILEEPSTIGELFNLGNPEEIAVIELARRVIVKARSTSPISFVPFEEAFGAGFEDIARRVPDIAKIRKAIGFDPKTPLDEIIASVIDSVRERRQVA